MHFSLTWTPVIKLLPCIASCLLDEMIHSVALNNPVSHDNTFKQFNFVLSKHTVFCATRPCIICYLLIQLWRRPVSRSSVSLCSVFDYEQTKATVQWSSALSLHSSTKDCQNGWFQLHYHNWLCYKRVSLQKEHLQAKLTCIWIIISCLSSFG